MSCLGQDLNLQHCVYKTNTLTNGYVHIYVYTHVPFNMMDRTIKIQYVHVHVAYTQNSAPSQTHVVTYSSKYMNMYKANTSHLQRQQH